MKRVLFLFAVMLIAVGMSVAQTSAGSASSNNGNAAQSSSTDQGTAGNAASNPDQNATSQSSSSDQSGTAAQGNAANQNAGNAGNLPQTGSELPLLMMLGLGSLGGGLISRFRK